MADQKTPLDENMSATTGKVVASDNTIINKANFMKDITSPSGSPTFITGDTQKTPLDKNMSAVTGKIVASDNTIINIADFIKDITDPESGVVINANASGAGAAAINVIILGS